MSFLYYILGGDILKIYVDLVLFLNIAMDFLLLLSVSMVLKRNVKFYRIILGGITGGLLAPSFYPRPYPMPYYGPPAPGPYPPYPVIY